MNGKPNMVVILGPTASGKTRLAARLARDRRGEVISADSRQVYRGMDLGTGKDRGDYVCDGAAVPVHLLDVADPREEFHLFAYNVFLTGPSGRLRGGAPCPSWRGEAVCIWRR